MDIDYYLEQLLYEIIDNVTVQCKEPNLHL